MYTFETCYDTIAEDERIGLSKYFAHESMGEIALEWGEIMRASLHDDHKLVVVKIRRENEFVGIAMLSIIQGLDPAKYVWSPVATFMKLVTSFDVGFLEIPLSNKPGILTREDIAPVERGQILHAVCAHIRETVPLDVLCVKVDDSVAYDDTVSLWKGVASLSFYPNAVLDYPYAGFEEYLNSLSRKKWRRVRSDRRTFEKQHGQIEVCHDIAPVVPDIYALYKKTSAMVEKKSHYIAKPLDITEEFFTQLSRFPRLNPCVLLAKIDEKIVAYCLVLQSGKTLFLKAVGLDYDLSYPTKAYFNLLYAVLDYAARQQCDTIDFGMTTYQFKQWLGCELHPATYLAGASNPVIAMIQKPVARLIERRIGTGME